MKEIELTQGEYTGSWSLTDFYPDSKKALKKALESGEEFTAEISCKKEIRYGKLRKTEDEIELTVCSEMDDLWEADDLIYDALWKTRQVEEELPDNVLEYIRDTAMCQQLDYYSMHTAFLPVETTFEELCDKISEMENITEKLNEDLFERLCTIVADAYDWWKKQSVVI